VNGVLRKIGKPDLNRITKRTKKPTRIHQQVEKLKKTEGTQKVVGNVVEDLGQTTTGEAKAVEEMRIREYYNRTGIVPRGNERSFKP